MGGRDGSVLSSGIIVPCLSIAERPESPLSDNTLVLLWGKKAQREVWKHCQMLCVGSAVAPLNQRCFSKPALSALPIPPPVADLRGGWEINTDCNSSAYSFKGIHFLRA